MKKMVLAALLAAVSTSAAAVEYVEISANGGAVNWTKGRVSAEGYGTAKEGANPKIAPMLACRAATADAQRNLLEVVQGTRINATTTVNNFMLSSDEVKTSVEGVLKGGRVLAREVDADNLCKITLAIDLGGKIASSIYSAEQQSSASLLNDFSDWAQFALGDWRVSLFPMAHANELPEQWMMDIEGRLNSLESALMNGVVDEAIDETAPTGLVIDARGSNFIPSLSPKVRELRGGVIYPEAKARESSIATGQLVSLFATDVDFAIRHPKVGERPLLLKALRTYGDTRTEIVLGKTSSEKLREMMTTASFQDTGVIIVLD